MVESATLLTLPRMCDLALNTPEVGVVNFTVLHSLLQVMISQLNLTDTNVEFRGLDSERIQQFMSASTTGNALTLTEYTIGGPDPFESQDGEEKQNKPRMTSAEKGSKDESHKEKPGESPKHSGKRISEVKGETHQKPKKVTAPKTRESLNINDADHSTIILVENSKGQSSSGTQFTVAVTKDHFQQMIDKIDEIEERMKELEALPGNEKIMHALATDSNEKTPVLDMYQILSLQKRMDAVDVAMGKLASMLETVGRGSLVGFDVPGSRQESVVSGDISKKSLKERVEMMELAIANLPHTTTPSTIAATLPEPTVSEGTTNQYVAADIDRYDISKKPLADALTILKLNIMDIKNNLGALPQLTKDIAELQKILTESPDSQPTNVQIKILESKMEDFHEQIHSLDSGFGRQVNVLQNRISDLEKQLGELMEKVNLMPEEVDTRPNHITSELHAQLVTLQEEFIVVSETVQKLAEDYSSKEHTIDILVEQIELLKTVKADREDLEDALADKADACQINRKVSFEQFDQACGDMSKSLEEALAKLSQQELLWNQALDNIQNSIGGKLDKVELNPLRDFINNKLKGLQEKFKTLNAMKRENEAAGTKSKYLKNVNCISCDKDVVMRKEMDPTLYPKPYAVPPSRSMGPYLAYELDQLRKQQKCLPSSKNMNTFENALQTSRSAKSPDHVCNRYCGGSHTVTTPQQRVTRLGHFLEQWGPEIAPVEDTHVRGTDGRMYKARDDQQLKQLASERPPTPHADNKPVVYVQKTMKSAKEDDPPWPAINQPSPGRKSGQSNVMNRSLIPKSDSMTKTTTEPAPKDGKGE